MSAFTKVLFVIGVILFIVLVLASVVWAIIVTWVCISGLFGRRAYTLERLLEEYVWLLVGALFGFSFMFLPIFRFIFFFVPDEDRTALSSLPALGLSFAILAFLDKVKDMVHENTRLRTVSRIHESSKRLRN